MTQHELDIGITWFIIGFMVRDIHRDWWPRWFKRLADRRSNAEHK